MYIRTSQQKSPSTGKTYITYRLVDTYRNPQVKVRQQLILNLGANFAVPKEHWKLLADRINELLTGQESLLALQGSTMLRSHNQTLILIITALMLTASNIQSYVMLVLKH